MDCVLVGLEIPFEVCCVGANDVGWVCDDADQDSVCEAVS